MTSDGRVNAAFAARNILCQEQIAERKFYNCNLDY